MTFPISAGVYPREINQSNIIASVGDSIGAIVINANQGQSDERVLVTNNKQFIDTFGTPVNNSMQSALAFLENANRLYVVRKTLDATAALKAVDDSAAGETFTFTAIGEGAYGNNITFDIATTADADIFKLTIYDTLVEVETFDISKLPNKLDGYGRNTYVETVINDISQYVTVVDNTANSNAPAVVAGSALAGGTDDTGVPVTNDIIAGYDLFTVKDEVEISLILNAGWVEAAVQTNIVSIAESRKDCFGILDVPYASAIGDMTTLAGTMNTSYAALYGPWVYAYDQYNDAYKYLPPSGHVGGVFAKTSQVSEVWNAPAGSRRGVINVIGVEKTLSEGERDTLYAAGVNPIQQFVGEGIQVYGQKTLTSIASALDRINVRLLMIKIEKALSSSLRPFVFEINDSFLRDNITSIVDNYLEDIKVKRGVYEYQVVCDESNNTAQVIDQNKLILDVYVKPTRIAEFIRVNAVVTATGVTLG